MPATTVLFTKMSTLTLGHKQLPLVPVVSSMLSQCPGPQQRRQATGATVTPACCRGIWAGASLACIRLVYGLWEAGSAARDSCWTCLVVHFTATFYLLIVTLGPLSFIRKHAEFELKTDTPNHSVPTVLPVLLQILFRWKKEGFSMPMQRYHCFQSACRAQTVIPGHRSRLFIPVVICLNLWRMFWFANRSVFHWRFTGDQLTTTHRPVDGRKRLNRVWEVSLLTAADRHNEDYTPDVSRPTILMKDPEAE